MATSKKDYVSKYKGEKIDELLEGVETLQGEGEGSVNKIVNDTVAEKIAEVVNDAPEDFDTLKEMSDWIAGHENSASAMNANIAQLRTDIDTLDNNIAKKQDIIQLSTMPTASADIDRKMYQYVGETTDDFIQGRFYKANYIVEKSWYWRNSSIMGYTLQDFDNVQAGDTFYRDIDCTSVYGTVTGGKDNYGHINVRTTSGSNYQTSWNGSSHIIREYVSWEEITEINDAISSDKYTYSSNKIENLIGSSNNLVKGYYNETDSKFYEEIEYQTEITGEANKIYISLDTDKLYYWNGTEYKLSSGGSEGSSGHIITNSLNEEQTEREKLKFSDDFNITDNEANDSTEISERLLTNQEIDDILDSIPTVNENGETVINNIIIDVPVGTILPLMQETAPDTYLICDGTEYLKKDYPELSETLLNLTEHTQYEGSDEDHFKVPDLRGEFLRGSGANSHENQGSGGDVGVHQDATIHQQTTRNGNTLYTNSNIAATDLYKNTDSSKKLNGLWWVRVTDNGSGSSYEYTSRPTNTSVLFCIKAISKETHNQAIVSSTIVNEQDNEYNGIPFRFAIDEDGNYGYIKDGADTVTPFKSGSGIGATIHLTANLETLYNKQIQGTDGTNSVTGVFNDTGNADIIVPTEGPWTFTCENSSSTIDSLKLSASSKIGLNPILFDNGVLNNPDYHTKQYNGSGPRVTIGSSYISVVSENNNSASAYLYWILDLTLINSIIIDYSSGGNPYDVCAAMLATEAQFNNAGTQWNSTWTQKVLLNSSAAQRTFNVSSLTGNYYFCLAAGGSTPNYTANVYKITLT